jgi:outer membrane receptor protein involved in Fe transport
MQRRVTRSISLHAVWLLLIVCNGVGVASEPSDGQFYDIDIPSLNAAEALNRLAEQTGAIMLFPYDIAETRQANAVRGHFTLMDALGELLKDSGLSSGLSDKRVIQIALDEQVDHTTEDGEMVTAKVPLKTKVGTFFASIFIATSVGAQEPADTEAAEAAIEEIFVTGSRLARDSFNVSTPLIGVDNEMLQDAGLGSIAQILVDEVPALFESSNNMNTQSSIGSTGLTTVNLRELGSNRTLTLIDGRRTVSNTYSGNYVSLNTIPRGMIERIEVVTGGSTATYGSDAIAGVINIITQKDFEGFGLYARGGTTSEGGGEEYTLSADYGLRFADDRGYFFAGVTYDEEQGIDNKDRKRAQIEADFDYNTSELCNEMATETGDQCMRDIASTADYRDRSDGTEGGVFSEGPGDWWFNENGFQTGWEEERDGLFSRIWDVILVPNETLSAAAKLNFDFTDRTTGYFHVQYSSNDSFNFKSPEDEGENQSVATIDPVTGLPGTVVPGHIASDNPFIPPELLADPNFPANWNGDWDRRMYEVGNITTDNERETWRTWAGLQGSMFDGKWDWDASIGYGHFEQYLIRSNEIDVRKEAQALDASLDPVTGQPICNDPVARAAGCVPLNLFGIGSITPEMADWIRTTPILNPTIQQTNFLAYMMGDLFSMPAGEVGAVFGFEYRKDEMEMLADDGSNYGGITYNIVPDIFGDMDVAELFTEFSFPLAESLTADISMRVGDYSHDNISTIFSYTVGLMWEVSEGFSLRANVARAQRAPDLTELFSPERGDYDSFDDICDGVSATSTGDGHNNCRLEPAIAAAIAADPNFVFDDDNNGYSPSAGNENLFEETADTYTIGFTVAPSFLEGFQLAVDYYDISIEDAIIEVENSEILKQCYNSSVTLGDPNPFCDDVTRDSDGQLIKLLQRQFNLNSQSTSGVDLALDWVWDIGGGDLEWVTHWTHILTHEAVFQGNDGPERVDYNNQLDFGVFEDVATSSLAWRMNNWRIRWRLAWKGPIIDHQDRVDEYKELFAENEALCDAGDPGCITNPEVPKYLYYPSYVRHDLSLSYDMTLQGGTDLNFFGGVRNMFDKDPFVPRTGDAYEGGIGNYDSKFGGGVGRFFYVGAEMRF